MNSVYFEAYDFYKKQYAPNLVLFHVGSRYEAYEDDAERLAQVLNNVVLSRHQLRFCDFPEEALEEIILLLLQADIPVSTIEYRNEQGSFSIPKVKQIMQDIEDDY